MAKQGVTYWPKKRTHCDECGRHITLDIVDGDGVLIGAECSCGSYVTRYMPGMKPEGV